MTRVRLTALVAGVAAAAAFAAAWIYFAPAQVGGGTSYAILFGDSMEPKLHRGDLAVVRRASAYRPGDVVLYRSSDLGVGVLHRIERVEHGRFVLKGDNNDFLDPERPTEEQIVGKLWVSVPAVGRISEWLNEPLHAAIFMGAAALFSLGGLGAGAALTRRGAPRPPKRVGGGVRAAPAAAPAAAPGDDRLRIAAAVALVGATLAGLALVSFTRPLTTTESYDAAYAHQGRFSYSAAVARNAAYPDGTVETGDPVFLRLVPRLRVGFDYHLESELPNAVDGTVRLDARISDGRGWQRTLPLAGERRFAAGRARISGTLDLRRIGKLVEDVRSLTGSAQTAYTVSVVPHVTATGRVGADPLEATFAPSLTFDLGDLRLQPQLAGGEGGVGPLAPREPGRGTRTVAAELALGPFSPTVALARKLSLGGLALLLLLGGLALGRPRGGSEEHARIAARYGHLLVPVRPPAPRWPHVTELADFEALVRLALHHGRMILHVVDESGHAYVVEEGHGVFRYRAALPALREAGAPAQATADGAPRPVDAAPVRQLVDGELILGGGGARYRAPRRFGLRRRRVA